METDVTALILLLLSSLGTASADSPIFYGDSIIVMPVKKNVDGTYRVAFTHRQSGMSGCAEEAALECESGSCTNFEKSGVQLTDEDAAKAGLWCQTESFTTATVSTNESYVSMRGSGCCWRPNYEGLTDWTIFATVDLRTRSDSRSVTCCPVTTVVSSLRVPQNCFKSIELLAHDPDGDEVRCSFSPGANVPENFSLDERACVLNSVGIVNIGVHVFEVLLEDFPTQNITLTYMDGTSVLRQASDTNSLCRVKLQFLVEILDPISSGDVQPMFTVKTPSHGQVLYATVDQPFQLKAQARSQTNRINDFQVSGPQDMRKEFEIDPNGIADVTVTWTPRSQHLFGSIPICFTAETLTIQSEMRCVVVMVTEASILEGNAKVECSPNKIDVVLEKSSMPGIDERFLQLRDPSCSLTSNETHIMGSMSLSTCGTVLEEKGEYIVYKNEINSFVMPEEIITRRKRVRIDISCLFPRTFIISNYFRPISSDYIFTESSFGSFSYTFDIFKDATFTTKVEASAYPVEVNLLEKVYMGIQARSEVRDVKIFVESCKATPDENPENDISYNLIKSGCTKDETLRIHPSEPTVFNFEIQAFRFTGKNDQVFISCSVIICEAGSLSSRCTQGCLTEPKRKRRRTVGRETGSHYITQGPLQIRTPVPSVEIGNNSVIQENRSVPLETPWPALVEDTESDRSGEWKVQEMMGSNIMTVVFAIAFLVSLVCMGLGFYHIRRRVKEEDRKALISPKDS